MSASIKRCSGRAVRVIGLAVASLVWSPSALGGGLEVPMQGARAAGQADAFVAQADDPSAIHYNPAGLTQLKGTQISIGGLGLFPDWQFDADSGPGRSMHIPSVIPQVYATTDFGLERWRFGLGINAPFGMNEEWGDEGPLRFISDKAHLAVVDIQPTIAYRVTDDVSVGLGVNFYFGQLMMTRNVPLGPPPTPEGEFHFSGSAWSSGVTPSVLWRIDEHNTVGAFYRTPFTLDFGGDASVQMAGVPVVGPSRSHMSIDFPQQVGVGYAWRPVRPLKVEADVVWSDWDTLDRVTLRSGNPAFNGSTIPSNWMSGFAYRLGVQYELSKEWTVRAGYAYGQNSIPSSTFSPLVPDSNYHLFAVGAGYRAARWSLDAAYQLIYRESREINDSVNGDAVKGTWDNTIHTVMLTLTFQL
jgi:long-chain fatty acid transport protein